MKTKFKVLIAAVLFAGMGTGAFAQATTTALNASATIVTALTLTQNAALAFGNLSATTSTAVVLDALTPANNANLNEGFASGKMTVAGSGNLSILVTPASTITLSDGDSHTMTVTLKTYGGGATDGTGAAVLTNGSTNEVDLVSGNYYLFVGGSIPTLSNQTTGSYTGTANFVVEYN